MILSTLSGTCCVCGKHRSRHNSRKCSAIRAQRGSLPILPKEPPEPLRLRYVLSDRKLRQMGWL
jgi:hypothetical protein